MSGLIANRQTESGNVLFLIIIAVVLFAALSFAVTNSTNTGDSSKAKSNEMNLQASEILQYLSTLKQVVLRLQVRGCELSELSFEGSPFDGSDANYVNPNSPPDFSCHVFHPDGGNFSEWVTKPFQNENIVFSSYKAPRYTGTWFVGNIGLDPAPELMVLIGMVNEDLCFYLNEKLGVTNPGNILPKKNGSHIHTTYQGGMASSVPGWASWTNDTLEVGHHTACVNYEDRSPTEGLQIIYKVLAEQ